MEKKPTKFCVSIISHSYSDQTGDVQTIVVPFGEFSSKKRLNEKLEELVTNIKSRGYEVQNPENNDDPFLVFNHPNRPTDELVLLTNKTNDLLSLNNFLDELFAEIIPVVSNTYNEKVLN